MQALWFLGPLLLPFIDSVQLTRTTGTVTLYSPSRHPDEYRRLTVLHPYSSYMRRRTELTVREADTHVGGKRCC